MLRKVGNQLKVARAVSFDKNNLSDFKTTAAGVYQYKGQHNRSALSPYRSKAFKVFAQEGFPHYLKNISVFSNMGNAVE